MVCDKELVIRPIEARDLNRLWELIYKDEAPEFKKWDAPYFEHRAQTYEVYCQSADEHVGRDDMWVIEVDGTVYGTVSFYYEDAGKNWLEVGIILHQADRWNRGIGTRALKLWVGHLFQTLPTVRVGLTTCVTTRFEWACCGKNGWQKALSLNRGLALFTCGTIGDIGAGSFVCTI